jgi:hypothetical protein
VELNANGDTLWTNSIDKKNGEVATFITVINNDIVISGYYRTSNTTFAGFVMRLDATGKEIWYKSLQTDGFESPVNIAGTSSNEIVVVGTKTGQLNIVRLDFISGSILSNVTKSGYRGPNDFQLTADGGLVITGGYYDKSGTFFMKTDQNGN